jgi:hypothetical protein
MPPTFRFVNRDTAVWTPIALNEEDSGRDSHSFQAAARLRPGVSLSAAKAELDALGRSLARQYPDENRNETATLTPMSDPRYRTVVGVVGNVKHFGLDDDQPASRTAPHPLAMRLR